MKHCYVLFKTEYADFDIPYDEPIEVSFSKDYVVEEKRKRNLLLNEKELRDEVSYGWKRVKFVEG